MITLRQLTPKDEQAFLEGLKEWDGEDPHWHSFCWKDGMKYSEMLEILRKEDLGIDLAPGRVQHTMLYAFDNEGKIVGRLSVRHTLNAELLRRGGHIGYAVAPRFRKKGYATAIVRQGLSFCRELGLEKIMITCSDDNEASWRIIEKIGGKDYEKFVDETDNKVARKYWVKL